MESRNQARCNPCKQIWSYLRTSHLYLQKITFVTKIIWKIELSQISIMYHFGVSACLLYREDNLCKFFSDSFYFFMYYLRLVGSEPTSQPLSRLNRTFPLKPDKFMHIFLAYFVFIQGQIEYRSGIWGCIFRRDVQFSDVGVLNNSIIRTYLKPDYKISLLSHWGGVYLCV